MSPRPSGPPPAPPARKRGSALGSSSSTEEGDVRVGRLGSPHGLDGFLGLYVAEEDLVCFEPGSTVYVDHRPFVVRVVRRGKKGPQVSFEGVGTREAADSIRGSEVFVSSRRELTEGEYWPGDLVGLAVRPGGGTVIAVEHGAAQDRLVIERSSHRFEVPFVDELVPVVDIAGGYVEVVEIEGLSSLSDRP